MDYINHETKEQISLSDIKAKYKNSSFPTDPRDELLKSIGYYKIYDGKIPEYNTYHQIFVYNDIVHYNEKLDKYERQYAIIEKNIKILVREKIEQIDTETSNKILSKFTAEINGELIKFSYDSFDQQNFADKANLALNYKINNLMDKEIKCSGYKNQDEEVVIIFLTQEFIDFYTDIVVEHKSFLLEQGKARKKGAMADNIQPEILQYI